MIIRILQFHLILGLVVLFPNLKQMVISPSVPDPNPQSFHLHTEIFQSLVVKFSIYFNNEGLSILGHSVYVV